MNTLAEFSSAYWWIIPVGLCALCFISSLFRRDRADWCPCMGRRKIRETDNRQAGS